MSTDTPLMQQYKKIKEEYQNEILMFRLGDFYEMFFEDAKIASKELGLTLTKRNKEKRTRCSFGQEFLIIRWLPTLQS